MKKMELRTSQISMNSDDGELTVSGYVNKPGELSEMLGNTKKFREKISPGAFKRAVENRSRDIDFLAEHDSNKVLASTRNDSLELREDDEGFFMSAKISKTTYGKDYYQLIKDNLVSSMSFGFRSLKDSWSHVNGIAIRTIEELELFEVSVVKNPAYSQSAISARGIDLVEELDIPDENNKQERGHKNMTTMKKLEKRDNSFEDILRGQAELRNLNTTADGGALIPENIQGEIIKKMEEISPAFANARKFASVNGDLKIAKENDAVSGGFFGEGEEILEEALGFDEVKLTQKRLGAAITLSNQLINDSAVDIVGYSNDLMSRRLAKLAERSIFTGTGEKDFKGILNDKEVKTITTDALTVDTLMDLYTSIHPEFLDGAAFYFDRNTFNQIAKLKDTNGHFYLQNGVVNGKANYTLFNQPVHITETLDNEDVLVFANLAQAYGILVKQGFSMKQVIDSKQALRGSRLLVLDGYMDGAVYNPQAITKIEFATE